MPGKPPFPRLRGKVPAGRMGGNVHASARMPRPHPALRATFSRKREKDCECRFALGRDLGEE